MTISVVAIDSIRQAVLFDICVKLSSCYVLFAESLISISTR